ncbi:MAG: IS66 family transposase [Bryobacterales bacterium]|nr:IS66 family transposase [Bryobacterales bacterium]
MPTFSPLTFAVLEGYLHCKYLGLLRFAGEHGDASEYLVSLDERRRGVRIAAVEKFRRNGGHVASEIALTREALLCGEELILDARLIRDGIVMEFPGLQRVPGRSALGSFHYLPVLFSADRRSHKLERALLEVLALLLEDIQGVLPRSGVVYHGSECRMKKVHLSADLRTARDLTQILPRLQRQEVQPRLLLNEHCPTCEFSERCRDQAVREDNISLLRGLGQKAITAYARKGILTLTQLAHTFRPRRKGKRSSRPNSKRYHALHALALRDHRVYVMGTPVIPSGDVIIYLDLEGIPDQGFVYLIGMIVRDGTTQTAYSFWADSKDQERSTFDRFLNVIARYDAPTFFAYGGYERAFLKRLRGHTRRKKLVDAILDRLVNVLGIIYAHFYFPTYTNGLKEIGQLLGCMWTEGQPSGIQSLLWRQRWETSREETWKTKLIAYNHEDCAALSTVTEYLRQSAPSAPQNPPIVPVQELDRLAYTPKWGRTNFANQDFVVINSRAYFDYQQQRVFVRTSKTLKKRLRKPGVHRNRAIRANKRIEVTATRCPMCKGSHLRRLSRAECVGMRVRSKRSLDLVITPGGMHRRVLECWPVIYQCALCDHRFRADRYGRLATHGHALMSWAMHAHVAHGLSYGTVEELFREFFGLSVNDSEIHMFKGLLARYYRTTYERLMAKLASGAILHVDETEVRLRTGKGYVWVFASIEDVAYVYRPSREGKFLKDMLKDFRGVLVSDFYAAYDGLACPQQKCLIHLIRDLNQMLLANPYDREVQIATEAFGGLLRQIVATIDEHGLSRHYLARHRKDVKAYFQKMAVSSPQSEAAQAIRDRLLRYQDRLFTFLQHDNVPWNNNNAENAIKQFAYYRESRPSVMKDAGLRDYLVLLSLYQTCRYKGLSFLQFLLSGERDIEAFATTKRRGRRQTALPLYPKGFTPPHFAFTKR